MTRAWVDNLPIDDGEKNNNKRFYPNLAPKRIFNSVEDENLVIFAEVQLAFKIDKRIF